MASLQPGAGNTKHVHATELGKEMLCSCTTACRATPSTRAGLSTAHVVGHLHEPETLQMRENQLKGTLALAGDAADLVSSTAS
jgi:hypothetical protein